MEEAEVAGEQAQAAKRAAEIWKAATSAGDHPYLALKRIEAHGPRVFHGDSGMESMRGNPDAPVLPGMRVYDVDRVTGRLSRVIGALSKDGCLIVPLRDSGGMIHSLQFIAADGTKRFLPGGRVQGCYFSIGRPKGTICLCEGFASGATIHEATGHAVAVAFSAGNLKCVALALRKKFHKAKIIICGDNDRFTVGNPGATKAQEAALAIHGYLAIPRFDDIGPYDYYKAGEVNG